MTPYDKMLFVDAAARFARRTGSPFPHTSALDLIHISGAQDVRDADIVNRLTWHVPTRRRSRNQCCAPFCRCPPGPCLLEAT